MNVAQIGTSSPPRNCYRARFDWTPPLEAVRRGAKSPCGYALGESNMAETGKGGADKSTSMRVDTALVRELAELLSANDLNEIEVEDGERKIKVRRDAPHAFVAAPAPMAAAALAAAPAAAPVLEEEVAGEAVKSPMVGTAYLSAE